MHLEAERVHYEQLLNSCVACTARCVAFLHLVAVRVYALGVWLRGLHHGVVESTCGGPWHMH